jgi:hypothetical protein
MIIQLELSDKAIGRINRIAGAYGQNFREYVNEKFVFYEKAPDISISRRIETAERVAKKQKAAAIFKKYRWQKYYLKKISAREWIEIGWRTHPIFDTGNLLKSEKEHIGEYFYKITHVKSDGAIGFNSVLESRKHYRTTLKRLKKAINAEFKKFGFEPHYKTR